MSTQQTDTPEADVARNWQNVKVSKDGETHTLGTLIQLLENERDDYRKKSDEYLSGLLASEGELVATRRELVEKDKQLEAMREAVKTAYEALESCHVALPEGDDTAWNALAKLQPFITP